MKKSMLILIILASLIPGILAVVQYFENDQKEKLAKQNEKELQTKIDNLNQSNNVLLESVKQLSKDNVNLSRQLTETALKLNKNVIGGDEIDFDVSIASPNEFSFRILNKTNFPINNANIVIQDFNEIIKCKKVNENDKQIFIKKSCYADNYLNYFGVYINPKGMFYQQERKFPILNGYMNFTIYFETLKSYSAYLLVYKVIEGKMIYSYRKFEIKNNKFTYVSEVNNLKLNDEYWDKHFYKKLIYTVD